MGAAFSRSTHAFFKGAAFSTLFLLPLESCGTISRHITTLETQILKSAEKSAAFRSTLDSRSHAFRDTTFYERQ